MKFDHLHKRKFVKSEGPGERKNVKSEGQGERNVLLMCLRVIKYNGIFF